jgi:hypothetical protein
MRVEERKKERETKPSRRSTPPGAAASVRGLCRRTGEKTKGFGTPAATKLNIIYYRRLDL